jgi:hypothetical protein
MPHRHRPTRPVIEQPHVRRMAIFVVAIMIIALMVYGYQFWWTE